MEDNMKADIEDILSRMASGEDIWSLIPQGKALNKLEYEKEV